MSDRQKVWLVTVDTGPSIVTAVEWQQPDPILHPDAEAYWLEKADEEEPHVWRMSRSGDPGEDCRPQARAVLARLGGNHDSS